MKFDSKKIVELRERYGLTQYKFAQQIGTNRQRVHQWEMGITKPNMAALEKLCIIFRVEPNYFFAKNNVSLHG